MENNETITNRSIDDILAEVMQKTLDEKLPKMIENAVEKAAKDAVEQSFRWGEASRAISNRIDEIVVPAINSSNLGNASLKMEHVLNEALRHTSVESTRKMLENFAGLMASDDAPLKASELLKLFAKQCAYDVDCNGREVSFDSGEPAYEGFSVVAEFEMLDQPFRYSSSMEDAMLTLRIDDEYSVDEDEGRKLNREIRLWRMDRMGTQDDEWHILRTTVSEPRFSDLRNLSKLDLVLLRAESCGIGLVNDLDHRNDEIDVDLEATPEATYE